jgi:hypothetical protein
MKRQVSIVTTTVNVPYFIENYLKNFEKYQVDYNNVTFVIVGDLKSPSQEIRRYLKEFSSKLAVEYWDVKDQKNWMIRTFGNKAEKCESIIPYNSVRRRNIGYLRALELDSDVIITIDDDNYHGDSNWLSEHLDI